MTEKLTMPPYEIVVGASTSAVERDVKDLMQEGYVPCGSFVVTPVAQDMKRQFYQPMVRFPERRAESKLNWVWPAVLFWVVSMMVFSIFT